MNQDQKAVATLGLVLILIVLWTVYKTTLKAILFQQPSSGGNGLLNPGTWLNPWTNPISPLNPGVGIPFVSQNQSVTPGVTIPNPSTTTNPYPPSNPNTNPVVLV